ncbi:hypothetical protein PMZ80_004182 [Knufia obscura]|uniref:EthD domain-containing protein n=2 Tax=Knufia TaxID=430999 RepID=A0AAN8I1C8_9EURO|nr:hypothetical protein PMZ80_004182 [Knufia obscura]KAK5948692.1 hypothetical protein OHC33_010295 [Knufia fluminis]
MTSTVTVLYPATAADSFDLEYYKNTHMPFMAEEFKLYGLKGYTVTRFLASPTADNPLAPPLYTVQSTLEFDSIEQVKAAFANAGERVKAGLARVCPVEPQIIVGEVIARRVQKGVDSAASATVEQAGAPVAVAAA